MKRNGTEREIGKTNTVAMEKGFSTRLLIGYPLGSIFPVLVRETIHRYFFLSFIFNGGWMIIDKSCMEKL